MGKRHTKEEIDGAMKIEHKMIVFALWEYGRGPQGKPSCRESKEDGQVSEIDQISLQGHKLPQ